MKTKTAVKTEKSKAVLPTPGRARIPLEDINPSKANPRSSMNVKGVEDLAASIKEKGLMNPIVLNKTGDYYEIVAGHRRFEAVKLLGRVNVEALVYDDLTKDQMLELADMLARHTCENVHYLTQKYVMERRGVKVKGTLADPLIKLYDKSDLPTRLGLAFEVVAAKHLGSYGTESVFSDFPDLKLKWAYAFSLAKMQFEAKKKPAKPAVPAKVKKAAKKRGRKAKGKK